MAVLILGIGTMTPVTVVHIRNNFMCLYSVLLELNRHVEECLLIKLIKQNNTKNTFGIIMRKTLLNT